MPNIQDMKVSKFLKQNDLGEDGEATFIIEGVKEANVGTDDNPETKWTLNFRGSEKPMVLNWTNMQLCAKACGSEKTEDWTGKRIIVWFDDSVMFKGEMKGGLRIKRAPGTARPAAAPQPVVPDDDVPWDKD